MKNELLYESGKCGLALLGGVLLTLACAPFYVFPLAVVSAAFLLVLWLEASPRKSFRYGFCYGLGLFGSGVYWVFISMHSIAELPALAAGCLTLLLIAFLALYPGLLGYILNRYFPRCNNAKILCAFPALWVLFEWIRSWLFSGFPWLFIGFSQTHSPLKGFAPLASVYAVSLATVMSAALIVNAIRYLRSKHYLPGYLNLLGLVLIWVAGGLLNQIAWTQPTGKPFQVSLIQANIPQQMKWLPDQVVPTLEQYKDLSQHHWDSQLVVWPEAAIPAPLTDVVGFVEEMSETAKTHNAQLITGVPIKNVYNNRYFNAVISVGQQGPSYYLKHHLVPFGEYIPMEKLLGRLLDLLQVPMSDFTPAYDRPQALSLHDHIKMLTFICVEIAFPEQVLWGLNDANLLLTVTNDAWFGHSIAQAQHLQMAQMRSIETGRPMMFASNNGITALISPQGYLMATVPPFKTEVLTGQIQPYTGKTPWQKYAMDPLLLLISLLLGLAFKYRGNNGRTI